MTKSSTAQRCFEENLKFFSNAKSEPEKYNLYKGLAMLAQAIQDMENDIRIIKRIMPRLK